MAKHDKFIINDGKIHFGHVEFHLEILGENNNAKTIGGGWWLLNEAEKKLYLYGTSIDFGSVTKDKIIEAWKQSTIPARFAGKEIIYSPCLKAHEVIQYVDKQEKLTNL